MIFILDNPMGGLEGTAVMVVRTSPSWRSARESFKSCVILLSSGTSLFAAEEMGSFACEDAWTRDPTSGVD